MALFVEQSLFNQMYIAMWITRSRLLLPSFLKFRTELNLEAFCRSRECPNYYFLAYFQYFFQSYGSSELKDFFSTRGLNPRQSKMVSLYYIRMAYRVGLGSSFYLGFVNLLYWFTFVLTFFI